MAPRRKISRRSRRGRRPITAIEGYSRRVVFSGEVAGNGTVALNTTFTTSDTVRVSRLVVQLASAQPTKVSVSIRGEDPEEQLPTALKLISQQRQTLIKNQPKSEGWWPGSGNPDHLGWINNISSTSTFYVAYIWINVKTAIKPVTRYNLTVTDVFPDSFNNFSEDSLKDSSIDSSINVTD